jgi:DNA-binding response OmpR family regulator
VHTLSPKEAGMLSLLRQHGGRAVSRALFLKEVWGGDQFVGDRTIDTHMLNLRQKVELDPKQPRFLLTVHGVGYRLVEGLTDNLDRQS